MEVNQISVGQTNSEKMNYAQEAIDDIGELIEKKKLQRKIDLRILPFAFLIQMASYLDRVNIGYAQLYDLEKDLRLQPGQYQWILSIFFVGYVLLEVPSNLMLKRASPPKWLSLIMLMWGMTTMSMASAQNFTQLLVCRVFLGIAESGVFPGIVLYLSFWYPREDQGSRLSFVTSASSLACTIGGPIAYGIQYLGGVGGLSKWQWIFILEGIPTVILAILVFLLLPDSPRKAKWLNEEEQSLLTSQLTSGHVDIDVDRFDSQQFWGCFTDYKTYLYMLSYFGILTPTTAIALLVPRIVKDLGFVNTTAMLLCAPPFAIGLVFNLLVAWNSDRVMERGFHVMGATFITFVGFLILVLSESKWVQYAGVCFGAIGSTAAIAPSLSWSNNNLIGSTKSATSTALIIMFGNSCGILAGHFYTPSEYPRYIRSHSINLASSVMTICVAGLLRYLLSRDNKKLDQDHSNTSTFRYIL